MSSNIDTIIFDFGDVFINLDKQGALQNALDLFNLKEFPEEMTSVNILYEQGLISTKELINFYSTNFPEISEQQIVEAWNFILKDFPYERLEFLKSIQRDHPYKLILLSNTNELHIDWVKDNISFYNEFKSCFDAFYLSHEIQLRKPDHEIFNFVIQKNNLTFNKCLFIDDTLENTNAAAELGIHIWNIDETKEDIRELFIKNPDLF